MSDVTVDIVERTSSGVPDPNGVNGWAVFVRTEDEGLADEATRVGGVGRYEKSLDAASKNVWTVLLQPKAGISLEDLRDAVEQHLWRLQR